MELLKAYLKRAIRSPQDLQDRVQAIVERVFDQFKFRAITNETRYDIEQCIKLELEHRFQTMLPKHRYFDVTVYNTNKVEYLQVMWSIVDHRGQWVDPETVWNYGDNN